MQAMSAARQEPTQGQRNGGPFVTNDSQRDRLQGSKKASLSYTLGVGEEALVRTLSRTAPSRDFGGAHSSINSQQSSMRLFHNPSFNWFGMTLYFPRLRLR